MIATWGRRANSWLVVVPVVSFVIAGSSVCTAGFVIVSSSVCIAGFVFTFVVF